MPIGDPISIKSISDIRTLYYTAGSNNNDITFTTSNNTDGIRIEADGGTTTDGQTFTTGDISVLPANPTATFDWVSIVPDNVTWSLPGNTNEEKIKELQEMMQIMIEEQAKTNKLLQVIAEGMSKILPRNFQKDLRDG